MVISTELSMKVQLLIKTKKLTNKKNLVIKLSDVVFILLINVKMSTIVGFLTTFHAHFSWAWKTFYSLKCWFVISLLIWIHLQDKKKVWTRISWLLLFISAAYIQMHFRPAWSLKWTLWMLIRPDLGLYCLQWADNYCGKWWEKG